MKHATSRELYAYWDRVRAGAPAPRRSDIEPSDIRRILADTFILEVADRGTYPIRLAGTRICGAYGREIKGDDFLDFWSPQDRDAVATLGTAVAVDAAAAVVSVIARTARDKVVPCELLILPLRHGEAGYDRILGSFAALEQPYWLGSEAIAGQTITSLRLIWPEENPRFLRRASDRAVEEQPVIVPFPVPNQRRRGHLTVLDGGKE
jgi:hypothetical protein